MVETNHVDQSGQVTETRTDAADTDMSTRASVRGALGATIVLLVIHNAIVAVGINEPMTLLANLALAGTAVAWARAPRLSRSELGLELHGKSVYRALALALLVAGVLTALALSSAVSIDITTESIGPGEFWFRALIGIPLGTAVCEELIFRGMLLAHWDRLVPPTASTAAVSIAFGLWHVLAEAQRVGPSFAILVGVGATAAASAFVLCPLRRRTDDLVVPVALHAAINVAVLTLVYLRAPR